jgi:hypothetical protein
VISIDLIEITAKNTNNNQSVFPTEYHTIIHMLNESMGWCEKRISFNTLFLRSAQPDTKKNRMLIPHRFDTNPIPASSFKNVIDGWDEMKSMILA